MIYILKKLNPSRNNYYQIFNIFLVVYLIIGFYFSIQTGISHDESIEQANWRINFAAIKDIFGNNDNAYSTLLAHKSKYYGIGFNLLSQTYVFLLGTIIKFETLSTEASKILLGHSFIFITFSIFKQSLYL